MLSAVLKMALDSSFPNPSYGLAFTLFYAATTAKKNQFFLCPVAIERSERMKKGKLQLNQKTRRSFSIKNLSI